MRLVIQKYRDGSTYAWRVTSKQHWKKCKARMKQSGFKRVYCEDTLDLECNLSSFPTDSYISFKVHDWAEK